MLYLIAQLLVLGLNPVRLLRGNVTLCVTALTAAMNKTVVSSKIFIHSEVKSLMKTDVSVVYYNILTFACRGHPSADPSI